MGSKKPETLKKEKEKQSEKKKKHRLSHPYVSTKN